MSVKAHFPETLKINKINITREAGILSDERLVKRKQWFVVEILENAIKTQLSPSLSSYSSLELVRLLIGILHLCKEDYRVEQKTSACCRTFCKPAREMCLCNIVSYRFNCSTNFVYKSKKCNTLTSSLGLLLAITVA